jgi:hypothetical protein
VKPHNISIKFGKGDKLSPRFMGPFDIVEKKGPMSYQLALPDSLTYARCFSRICFETLY